MQALATGFRRALPRIAIALAAASACECATALDWALEVTPDKALFPVLDLSQARRPDDGSAGGGSGSVAVRVRGEAGQRVRLTIEMPGLSEPAVVAAALPAAGTLELRPRLQWDRGRIGSLRASTFQTLVATLQTTDGTIQTRELGVRLHPLEDALYYVREGPEHVDLGWVFAAYVDPDEPVVDAVLAAARAAGTDLEAPASDRAAVIGNVRAIWSVMESHGLRYAPGDPAVDRGPSIWSQRVRLVADSWAERRANCIDSSVLIASVLERIGIGSFIVLVPHHAFVGFYTAPDRGAPEFLETTLLGTGPSHLPRGAKSTFDAARAAGRLRWNRVSSRLDRAHRPDYALIDIDRARAYGIVPLTAGAGGIGARRRGMAARAAPMTR